jgi:hypothetical protein
MAVSFGGPLYVGDVKNGECLKNVRGGRMNASASFFYPGRFVNF